jgi:GxxExxY protein
MTGDQGDGTEDWEGSTSPSSSDDELTRVVIAAIIRVHQALGPGFIESVYHRALAIELTRRNVPYFTEHELAVCYEGELVGVHRLDLLIDGRVVVELKAIEELTKTHYAQLRSYLNAARLNVGILVNFAKDRADYRRVTPHGPRSGR